MQTKVDLAEGLAFDIEESRKGRRKLALLKVRWDGWRLREGILKKPCAISWTP